MREARAGWDDLRSWILERVSQGTVLCLPTLTALPPRLDAGEDERQAFAFPSLSVLAIAVLAGLPQISLPGAEVEGVPVGLSLIGPPASDEVLLELAVRLAAPD